MNLSLLSPEICILGTAVLVVLLDLFVQRKGLLALVSILGLLVSAALSLNLWDQCPATSFNDMLALDHFAVFFKLFFIGISILVVLVSRDYVAKFARFQGEYHALLLLSTVGMLLMSSVAELISLFVSLELVNICLYALVSFLKDARSTEASLKYLLLSAVASAIMIFGMALVFGFTGETNLAEIAAAVQTMPMHDLLGNSALLLGVVLMIAGFGFKIAMVPFHMWVPDVYEGAPTPITAYLSVAGKAAGFAIVLRIFFTAFMLPEELSLDWGIIFAVISAVTMTFGNIIAIQQSNIKRMMGYSSIAQVGYVLVGLAAVGLSPAGQFGGQSGILFFLASYALTNLGAFIAIIAITNKINSDEIDDFRGMARRSPWIAAALTLCLVSLIGLPPAAGFMAKFYIFSAAVGQNLLWLVIIAVANSVISAYYYLRVIKEMWTGNTQDNSRVVASGALKTALLLCCLGVLLLGVVPGFAINLAELARMLGG